MTNKIKISPSILSADFSRLGEEVRALCEAGADYIHVDVMDGHFVRNITIGPCVVEKIKKYSTVPLDVHLMISNPDKYVKDFISAGADILTIHAEAEGCHTHIFDEIKSGGVKAGIAVSPSTSLEVLENIIDIKLLDLLLIMTVEPGFGNQKFLFEKLKKIRNVKLQADQLKLSNLLIAVDGGINQDTALECIRSGANMLIAGSYIFRNNNYKSQIESLKP